MTDQPTGPQGQRELARDGEWEKCGRCGIRYPEVYWADDGQWAQVVGDTFGGLRCLACFCEQAQDIGLTPNIKILSPSLAMLAPTQEPADTGEPNVTCPGCGAPLAARWITQEPVVPDGMVLVSREEWANVATALGMGAYSQDGGEGGGMTAEGCRWAHDMVMAILSTQGGET